jgi:malate dehydrogenase (oxaloacetate-decarboxylating)
VSHSFGQANNALLYPGLGLGTIVAGAAQVTDGMLLYVLADVLHQLVGYSVGQDGSLTQVTSVPVTIGSGGIGVS